MLNYVAEAVACVLQGSIQQQQQQQNQPILPANLIFELPTGLYSDYPLPTRFCGAPLPQGISLRSSEINLKTGNRSASNEEKSLSKFRGKLLQGGPLSVKMGL